jgi:hypothetical protein
MAIPHRVPYPKRNSLFTDLRPERLDWRQAWIFDEDKRIASRQSADFARVSRNPADTASVQEFALHPVPACWYPAALQRECGIQKDVGEAVFTQITAVVNSFRDAVRFPNGLEVLLERFAGENSAPRTRRSVKWLGVLLS